MAEQVTRIGRCKPTYACATPPANCSGKSSKFSAGIKNPTPKTHSDPADCLKCYGRYLLSLGYTQISKREFSLNGGPIQLLNKASKAYRLRGGKGERVQSRNKSIGGFITSA